MNSQDPVQVLTQLEQQPTTFEARRGLDRLYRDARAALEVSRYQAGAIRAYTGLDPSRLTAEGRREALELSARAGLQAAMLAGALKLYVLWPISGRFFALPPSALVSPFRFAVSIEGQNVTASAQHLGEATWRTGQLHGADCDVALAPLAAGGLKVFATESGARAAVRGLDTPQLQRAGHDSDEEVRETIRRLRAERGGARLPVKAADVLLREVHNLPRSDLRRLLAEVQGPALQGRPRKNAD